MFFREFRRQPVSPSDKETEGGTEGEEDLIQEINQDGTHKYLQGPEGELIINDPTLLISSEKVVEKPSKEDISKVDRFTQFGWLPLSKISFWAQ